MVVHLSWNFFRYRCVCVDILPYEQVNCLKMSMSVLMTDNKNYLKTLRKVMVDL